MSDIRTEYDDLIDGIHKRYAPEIIALMTNLAAYLRDDGFTTNGPHEISDDSYKWYLNIRMPSAPDDDSMDITIEIAESALYGDDPYGINFGLMIVEYGGRIIGDWNPFNYTERVWVDSRDPEAIEARWDLFKDGLAFHEVSYLIANR